MQERLPLAYFHGLVPGRYLATWPAFIVSDRPELLDAAHIIPDADPEGQPVVNIGLALCHLHHRAFDRFFLGIRPDYVIEVRPDILLETDGPTLRHAIQGLHGQRIGIPRREEHQPSPLLLEARFERFLEVATTP